MNAFSDLVVTFGSSDSPAATRLGNPWARAATGPGGIWSSRGAGPSVVAESSSATGRWSVWAVGDVFAYRSEVTDPLAGFAADLDAGREQAAELDMHAVVIAWDDTSRRLHVWVDRMGTMHAYVGGPAGRVRVGTPFSVVAETSSRQLDWVGITGFCGFGFYVADRTAYEDVRILRPATHTVFDAAGQQVSQERYWDWSYEPDHRLSDDDVVDAFHEVWRATLRRQLGSRRAIVPVSGGLDSRTIVAGLTGPGAPPDAQPPGLFTYGYSPSSQEIRIARRVAQARRLPIQEEVVGPYLFDRLDDVIGSVEGFSALTLPRQVGVSDRIGHLGDRVVGGHWGDVWFDAAGAPGAASSRPGDLVGPAFAKFAKRGREWLFDHVCRPNLGGQDPEELLREVLRAELERLPDLGDADMQLKALKTEQWSFRWTLASIRAYHLARPTLVPFYANDVVDLFLQAPSNRLPGRRLQTAYLRRHHPDLARVTWQDTGMSLFEHPWEPSVAFGRRAAAKAVRTFRPRAVAERNWEVQYRTGRGTGDLQRKLADLAARVGDTTLRDPLATLVGDLPSNSDASSGYAADTLITLSMILRTSSGLPGPQ